MRLNVPNNLNNNRIAVIIPARLNAQRLPQKPLAMIGDAPMIVHVMRRAFEAGFGSGGSQVIIACDDPLIADAINTHADPQHEAIAVLTDPELPSGSDRVYHALQKIDPENTIDIVINLQGDLPEIDASILLPLAETLIAHDADIATPITPLAPDDASKPQIVKAVAAFATNPPESGASAPVLYFSRHPIPHGNTPSTNMPIWHHVGIYAWRRSALKRFVSIPQSPLEKIERLEQLRALEDGMKIVALVVDTAPAGIDTPQDLENAQKRMTK